MSYGEVGTTLGTSRTDFDGLQLTPVYSTFEMEPLTFSTGRFTIGASPECDVQINVEGIADKHCMIVVGSRRTIVQAFSPMTWINDGAVKEGTLRSGDRFIVGPIEFKVSPVERLNQERVVKERVERPQANPLESMGSEPVVQPRPIPVAALENLRTTNPHQRHVHVEEMLNDVQGMLDELLHEKRSSEAEFLTQQEKLARYEADVQQQFREVEDRLQALHALREESRVVKIAGENRRVEQLESELVQMRMSLEEQQSLTEELRVQLLNKSEEFNIEQSTLREVRSEIEKDQEELQAWRQALREREARIIEIEERGEELSHREQELADKLNSVSDLESQLHEQQTEINARAAELSARSTELDSLQKEVHSNRLHLKTLQDGMSEREQQLTNLATHLEERAAELESRHALIEEQRASVEAEQEEFIIREQELSTRENTLLTRVTNLEEQSKKNSLIITDLDIRGEALQQQQLELQAQQVAFAEMQKSWVATRAIRDQEVVAQTAEINEKLADIELKESTLNELERELAEKQLDITEREHAHAASVESFALEREQFQEECLALKQQQERIEELADQAPVSQEQPALKDIQEQQEQLARREQSLDERFNKVLKIEEGLQKERKQLEFDQQSLLEKELSAKETEVTKSNELEMTLSLRQEELDRREEELEARAQQLSQQEEELAAAKRPSLPLVSEASSDTEQNRDEFNLHLESVVNERDHLQALRQELENERDKLVQEIREMRSNVDSNPGKAQELEEKLREATEERDAFMLERQALIAERQEFDDRLKEHAIKTKEWEEQSTWIREEREELIAEKDALEMERNLLGEERKVLQAQAVQLKELRERMDKSMQGPQTTEVDQQADVTTQVEANCDQSPISPEDHSQSLLLGDSNEFDLLHRNDYLDSAEQESLTAYSNQDATEDENAESEVVAEAIAESEEEGGAVEEEQEVEEDSLSEKSSWEVDEPADETTHLRSELAALFGLDSGLLKSKNVSTFDDEEPSETSVDELPQSTSTEDAFESEIASTDQDEEALNEEVERVHEEPQVEEESSSTGGEDSVAEYMERLLARTRRGAPAVTAPVKKKENPKPLKVVAETISAPVSEHVEKNIEKKRKLNSNEKEALRANMDSFRELANQSARSAVAKSHASRAQSMLTVYLTGLSIGWFVTVILLTAEFWMGVSQRTFGVISALLSIAFSIKAGLVYLDVQRNQATSIATFEMHSDDYVEEADSDQM